MPIREVKCNDCEAVLEWLLTNAQWESVSRFLCRKCGSTNTEKVTTPSRTSFRLMPGGAGGFHAPSRS